MTNKRIRARSTASSVPVITSSQTRSVSRPDHPPLLVMPSGGVRLVKERGLLTTAICASVSEAISSRRRRTSGLREGFEKGESRISERVTFIADRCWRGRPEVSSRRLTGQKLRDLDRAVLENETTGQHNLLVGAGNMKVVSLALVYDEVRNVATVELHSKDDELLDGISVGGESVWERRRLVGVIVVGMEVSRGGGGETMSRPAWIDEGRSVNIHGSGKGMRKDGY